MKQIKYKPAAFAALLGSFAMMGTVMESANAVDFTTDYVGYNGYGGYYGQMMPQRYPPSYGKPRPGYGQAYGKQRPGYGKAYGKPRPGYGQAYGPRMQPYGRQYAPAYGASAPANQQATASAAAAAPAADVNISGMRFEPAVIRIKAGEEVTWVNSEGAPHTVTSTSGNTLASSMLNTGNTFSFTFTEPGTYDYYCSVHPMMTGQVIVE